MALSLPNVCANRQQRAHRGSFQSGWPQPRRAHTGPVEMIGTLKGKIERPTAVRGTYRAESAGRRCKGGPVRIEESFLVHRPPEVVFDYLTDPATLAEWQTSKTSVEQLTSGPPRLGTRVRERTKQPGGREFTQVVEFTEFDRPRHVHAHIVEGPYPVHGTWRFEPQGAGTRVRFLAEGEMRGALRVLEPLLKRVIARQMASHHRNLRANLEGTGAHT